MATIGEILQSGSLAYTKPSPASVAARRALAQQLLESSRIQNAGPFGAIANALGGSFSGYENRQAGEQETTGREQAAQSLAEALKGGGTFDSLSSIASNPWLNDGQTGLVNALLGRQIDKMDAPPYQPNYSTINDNGKVYRYDQNDPNARPELFFEGTPEAPEMPAGVDEYNFAVSQGYQGTYEEWKRSMAQAGATNIDFNQNQGVAAGFADRMAAANSILSDPALIPAMTDPTKPALAGVPVAGNYMVGPEYQMAEQAQRDFVNAILRRESGAVISPSEFENAKRQYFPQPGDSPEVIQQKAANRQLAIDGVVRSAGPSYEPPPQMSPAPPQPSGDVVDFSTYFGGQ